MQVSTASMWSFVLCYLLAQARAYSVQGWPSYPQTHREYNDDDYYYAPKIQNYNNYDTSLPMSDYGQAPYPYPYDQYGHFVNEGPRRQEERLAALPIGQETWFESESQPQWRSNNLDDVNAAFMDNLILTQMAQEAQRRRENTRAAFQHTEYNEKPNEDEDVRELKALAGKPLYHVPKTVPVIDEDDYAADDSFINWNGNKRSVTTIAPLSTSSPIAGQKEIAVPRPAPAHQNHRNGQNKRNTNFYDALAQILAKEYAQTQLKESPKARRIEKRFVAGDSDLVVELRGLKHRIPT